MYRRAVFKRMDYELAVGDIESKLSKTKRLSWNEPDKNRPGKEIEMSLDIEHKLRKDGNYVVGISTKYQYSYGRGQGHGVISDFVSLMFFPKNRMLVVLGRDDSVSGPIREISNTLYQNRKGIKAFSNVQFGTDSLVKTIKTLRGDDSRSWCQHYNSTHGQELYEGKKATTNFSLAEGNCVLDDPEAQDAIRHATHINPTFKYYTCPKLKNITHDKPKTMRFNGIDGFVSTSVVYDFDAWYNFVQFLIKSLAVESV